MRLLMIAMLLFIFIMGCTPSTTGIVPEARSTTPEPATRYWDGGEWEGQPVYSLVHGISETAHNMFVECGLDDKVIETAVSSHLMNANDHMPSKEVLIASEVESDETLWSVSMNVEPLTQDVFLVTCTGKRP